MLKLISEMEVCHVIVWKYTYLVFHRCFYYHHFIHSSIRIPHEKIVIILGLVLHKEWKKTNVSISSRKECVANLRITNAAKQFIANATADDHALKLRFYGVASSEGMIIGADIDTLFDSDHQIDIEGYTIGISPEVLPSLQTATIHAEKHMHREGIILLNCK